MKKLLVACFVVVASIGAVAAQTYPSRPIKLVVPFPGRMSARSFSIR